MQVPESSKLPVPTTHKFLNLFQAENPGRKQSPCVPSSTVRGQVAYFHLGAGRELRLIIAQSGREKKKANIYLGSENVATNLSPREPPEFFKVPKKVNLESKASLALLV